MDDKKRYTIKDVAREAGVSPALVSFALNNRVRENGEKRYKVNEQTERRIMEVARKYNFRPNSTAKNLRTKRSQTIGVILSDISNPFFAEIARRIEDRAFAANYSVLFGSTDEKPKKLENIVETFVNKGIDGLIIVPCERSRRIVERVAARNIPLVLLDRDVPVQGVSRVVLDNESAGEMAVDALFSAGFRRVEMISYDMELSNIARREAGYLRAAERCGLAAHIHKVDYNRMDESMREVVGAIDFSVTDSLLFATNSLAVAGVKALGRMGLSTPADVGVVAFDGSDAFDLYPASITHILQPIEQFACDALDLAIARIENPDMTPKALYLSPVLVEGDSTRRRCRCAEMEETVG